MLRLTVCWILGFVICSCSGRGEGAEPQPPHSPAASRQLMQLADPELEVDLIASEPQINSPVSICWDADRRMYVVEMTDYPLSDLGGTIKRLEDRDGDGTYETVTLFAKGLKFPNGALPWNEGLLVTSAPDILYLKDTDGDGVAEISQVLFTGFVTGNQQLRVNGLQWGLDGWIYGANGRSGGAIRPATQPHAPPVSILRQDFRFLPGTDQFEALAGFSQFGLGRDDGQHRFLSWNTVPFRQAVIEEQDLNRNPYLTHGESIALLAEPGDTGKIFPISRVPKTFNRERTDYFNASAGSMIFRGDGLGSAYRGNLFVGEPLTNLISRRVLSEQGTTFQAKRQEPDREFLASRDGWFHPVFFTCGPDGAFYFADFYREWVEHPHFVQEALRGGVNFRTGAEHGRLWRIRRRGPTTVAAKPKLSSLDDPSLVQLLASQNGWECDTAQRLIVQRNRPGMIPLLRDFISQSSIPTARFTAMWTLSRLDPQAARNLAIAALRDLSPDVREQAISLLRRLKPVPPDVLSLVEDPHPRVRLQVALAAGDLTTAPSTEVLARLAHRDANDKWMRMAILSGIGDRPWDFLTRLWNQTASLSEGELSLCSDAASFIGMRNRHDELSGLLGSLKQNHNLSRRLLIGLGKGRLQRGETLTSLLKQADFASHREVLDQMFRDAAKTARDRQVSVDERLTALGLALQADRSLAQSTLIELLIPDEQPTIQSAAAHGLGELHLSDAVASAIEKWGAFPINTRRELVSALVRHPDSTRMLLDALESGQISPAEVDFTHRVALARSPHADNRERAQRMAPIEERSDRDAIVAQAQPVLALKGDATRGRSLFVQHCIVCHQMQGKGARVGPELSGVASRPKGALLVDLLNPSKEVSPDFLNYVAITKQGQILTGLLIADTQHVLRLRRQQEAEDVILRSNLEDLRINAKSLMPEGFEQKLPPQDLAHLLEFLQHPLPLP